MAVQNDRRTAEDLIREYGTTKDTENLKDDNNEEIFKYNEDEEENLFKEDDYNLDEDSFQDEDEKFECEMCFKKISREEYELYDFMCEECFMIAHTDKYGNFHDDEFFDF